MMRKLFLTVAVATMILSGIVLSHAQAPSPAQPRDQSPTQAQRPATRLQAHSATGKITAVSGDTFSIEVGQGDTKQILQFMTDSSTTKSGQLKVGSTATVQYRAGDDGKNMATKVDVQG